MAKLEVSLQQWVENRIIDVLGIERVEAHSLVSLARVELGLIHTNFNWSQPVDQASMFAKRFAWELALIEVAEWIDICPGEFIGTFGGDL